MVCAIEGRRPTPMISTIFDQSCEGPPTQSSRLAASTGATEAEVEAHNDLGQNDSQVAEWQSSRGAVLPRAFAQLRLHFRQDVLRDPFGKRRNCQKWVYPQRRADDGSVSHIEACVNVAAVSLK